MDAATLKATRPTEETVEGIRAAMARTEQATKAAQERVEGAVAARTTALLSGTAAEVRQAEDAIRVAEADLVSFSTITTDLRNRLTEASAQEAAAQRADQVREAAARITEFNTWLAEHYEPAARVIAEGVRLEAVARRAIEGLRDRRTGVMMAELPALARGYVHHEARSLQTLVRLPSATPGASPIVWP